MKTNLANYSLIALALFYIIMLGGGNYEQLNISSLVVKDLPKSLYILQGDYGFKPFKFWVIFRPVTILLFIVSLALHWKSSRRHLIVAAFAIDVLVTVATYVYFAPETETILSIPYSSESVDSSLILKAIQWKNYNWIRLGAFYAGSILILIALSNPIHRHETSKQNNI